MALKNSDIPKLKPKDKSYFINDINGLSLQVRPNGVKTFYLVFRKNKKQYKKTIGKFGDLNI